MKVFKNRRAFSIVEVLAASTLLGIAILGVAGFLQSASFKNNSSKIHTAGAAVMERTMEEQKALGYAALTNSTGTNPVTVDGVTYARNWTVTAITANGTTGRLKRVDATVSWGTGPTKQLSASMYMARPS